MTDSRYYTLLGTAYGPSTLALAYGVFLFAPRYDEPWPCFAAVLCGLGLIGHGGMMAWALCKAWRAK